MKISELIDEKIVHKVYGQGTITSIEGDYLNATFSNGKASKFSFPSCFDKFIKFSDEEKAQELQKYLNIWKTENGIFEQEMIHKMTAETQEGIKKRAEEREKRRLERAKEEAARNRMFLRG